jgi:hypothetical protein
MVSMLNTPEGKALTALTQFMKSVIALFEALNQLKGHETSLHQLFGEIEIELLRSTTREGLHRVVGGAPDTRAIACYVPPIGTPL